LKFCLKILLFVSLIFAGQILLGKDNVRNEFIYHVKKSDAILEIDGIWEKPAWRQAKTIRLKNFLGDIPTSRSRVKARVIYDENNIYVIFMVKERDVRCTERGYNGKVWEDSCVEFFFSPDSANPTQYFNLEVNCCKSILFRYNIIPRKEFQNIPEEDIKKIEVANTLSGTINSRNSRKKVKWTVEYRIPFVVLQKYSTITQPQKGTKWKANFYKIAEKSAYPHYMSWAMVSNAIVDFHTPQYFGNLYFD